MRAHRHKTVRRHYISEYGEVCPHTHTTAIVRKKRSVSVYIPSHKITQKTVPVVFPDRVDKKERLKGSFHSRTEWCITKCAAMGRRGGGGAHHICVSRLARLPHVVLEVLPARARWQAGHDDAVLRLLESRPLDKSRQAHQAT